MVLAAAAFIFAPGDAFANGTVADVTKNISDNVVALPPLIQYLFYISGVGVLGKGLMNAKQLSEKGQGSLLSVGGPMALGGGLIALPTVVETVYESVISSGFDTGELPTAGQRGGEMETLGRSVSNVMDAVFVQGGIFGLVQYIAYVVAIVLIGSAINGANKLSQGANGAPPVSGIMWRLIGAGALFGLPQAAYSIQASLFDNPEAAHQLQQASQLSGGTGASVDSLDGALVHLVKNMYDPVISITFAVVFFVGAVVVAKTLYDMANINMGTKTSPTQMVVRLLFGGLMMSSWSLYETITQTLFDMNSSQATAMATLAYDGAVLDQAGGQDINNVMRAVFLWVQMVGVIAFFRGWFTLKGSLDGTANSPKSAGITQVIAGAMCINIPTTVAFIGNTLGIKLLT